MIVRENARYRRSRRLAPPKELACSCPNRATRSWCGTPSGTTTGLRRVGTRHRARPRRGGEHSHVCHAAGVSLVSAGITMPRKSSLCSASGRKTYSLRKNTVNPWPLEETLPADMKYEREIMPLMQCRLAQRRLALHSLRLLAQREHGRRTGSRRGGRNSPRGCAARHGAVAGHWRAMAPAAIRRDRCSPRSTGRIRSFGGSACRSRARPRRAQRLISETSQLSRSGSPAGGRVWQKNAGNDETSCWPNSWPRLAQRRRTGSSNPASATKSPWKAR